jgi:hypothetical protein
MGLPHMSAKGLFGSREEAILAGMTPIFFIKTPRYSYCKKVHFFKVAFDSSIYHEKFTHIAISALRFARICDTISKIDEAEQKQPSKTLKKPPFTSGQP